MHPVTDEMIRVRAFDLWEQAGRPEGKDIDFWLLAARDLEEQARLDRHVAEAEAAPVMEFIRPERTAQDNRAAEPHVRVNDLLVEHWRRARRLA